MKTRFLGALAAIAAIAAVSAPAHAVVIDKTYTVSATRFGQVAPVDPVTLTFSVLFDTEDPNAFFPQDVTIRNFNLPTGLKYRYIKESDQLYMCTAYIVPTICDQPANVLTYNSNWLLHNFAAGNTALFDGVMGYSYNDKVYYESTNLYVRDDGASGLATAVPEPASWALMIVGFGAAGATMRRKAAAARLQRA